MNEVISNFPDISFIDNEDISDVLDQMISDYQEKYKEVTSNPVSLAQADPYRLIMYSCALQIYQAMQYADRAGKQSLLKYSYGDFLDNIAPLRGIKRLEATAATTTLRFEIESALASVVAIAAGTRVTNGNEVYFATDEYSEIPAGSTYVEVSATCTEAGVSGNEFTIGEFNTLVDTIPYITTVSNITETGGGSDRESDDSLRDRVYISPSSFSVAGPEDAYVYWTKSVSSNISDVRVTSPNPCEVDVRFILEGGVLPSESLIAKVNDVLQDSNIRPLTDQVTVQAPETVTYNIELTYYINSSNKSAASSIQDLVTTAVSVYEEWQSGKIGRDINPSYLIGKIIDAGAKRVVVTSPVYTTVDDATVPIVGTVTVNYGGIEND